jgi:hypothetical protein
MTFQFSCDQDKIKPDNDNYQREAYPEHYPLGEEKYHPEHCNKTYQIEKYPCPHVQNIHRLREADTLLIVLPAGIIRKF